MAGMQQGFDVAFRYEIESGSASPNPMKNATRGQERGS